MQVARVVVCSSGAMAMKNKISNVRWLAMLLLLLAPLALSRSASAQVAIGIGVQIGPPAIPVYVQPPCPEPNLIWAPGYWAWGPYGYYWVPGAWVAAPEPGLLWTPGWWGWRRNAYFWHTGYWGPRVGYYGGINYGFGYFGFGYVGGYWDRDRFFYNRDVDHLDDRYIHNVYDQRVERRDFHWNRAGFNGPGGIRARVTREQLLAARDRRFGATQEQIRQVSFARGNRALRVSFNHGRPPIAATVRPGVFRGRASGFAPRRQVNSPRGGNWRSFQHGRIAGRAAGPASSRGGVNRGHSFRAPANRAWGSRGQVNRSRGGVNRGHSFRAPANRASRSWGRQPMRQAPVMRRAPSRGGMQRGGYSRPAYRAPQRMSRPQARGGMQRGGMRRGGMQRGGYSRPAYRAPQRMSRPQARGGMQRGGPHGGGHGGRRH